MTPDEAEKAVRAGATVSLFSAHDHSEYAVGKAICYSMVPTITIELSPGGSRISWRHDLAEIVKPPKPEEPTGLGAVVEDAEGHIWVLTPPKVGYSDNRPPWWYSDRGSSTPHWHAIDAVRVLSEGVTP